MALVRLGQHLVSGDYQRAPDLPGVCFLSFPRIQAAVSESLVIFTDGSHDDRATATFQEAVSALFTSFLSSGEPVRLSETTTVVGFDKTSIKVVEDETPHNIPVETFFATPPGRQLAEAIALESRRDWFDRLAISTPGDQILESSKVLSYVLPVFLKKSPFRDMTLIREGTDVAIKGYFQGCAILEADGEEVYLQAEDDVEGWVKDEDYYLRQDPDHNLIQDPLDYLPSKSGLDGTGGHPEWNHSGQPHLPDVAGNFAAVPSIKNVQRDLIGMPEVRESYGILPENAAILSYYEDWQHWYEETHGRGGPAKPAAAPGVTADYSDHPEINAKRNAEYHKILDLLVSGEGPVDAVFGETSLPEFKEEFLAHYEGSPLTEDEMEEIFLQVSGRDPACC